MTAIAYDLRRTRGYLVADKRGRLVGRVETPMYGTSPDKPDALSVRGGFLKRRRKLVPADAIEQIDGASGVIGLRVSREDIRSFLESLAREQVPARAGTYGSPDPSLLERSGIPASEPVGTRLSGGPTCR